ncbi:hypothetical protein AB0K87_01580 [Streptomyces sp. NPDC053705]|uniref:hypothetical protein n=1 Tax=Streptomyces sp. NPDC053705 TaxID=3156668 RepID=UPI003448C699
MPNRPLTLIDILAAQLTAIAGDPIRLGQTGIRTTLAPIPMHTPDAYTQCTSVDLTDAGIIRILARLGVTPEQTAVMLAQPETGTEAA